MDFEFSLFLKSLPALARGAMLTAELTVVSILIGTAIGTVAGVGRLSSHRVLAWSVATYVTLMRGIPLLVTLLFLYYGLPSAGIKLDAFTVGVIALSITSGAYIAEIVRAGIQSIDPGQMRAARSLGMSYAKAMRRIILPQALRRVLPPMTNEALTLLKNTALVSTIALADLLRSGLEVMTWQANTFSPFAGVALFYLALTLPLIWLNGRLEQRYRIHCPVPPEFDLLVADARVLSPDRAGAGLERADIPIKDGRIVRLAPPGSLARHAAREVIAAGGGLAMPGLVNAHTHSPENLARGRAERARLSEWMGAVWPALDTLPAHLVRLAIEIGAAEMIRHGVTSVVDHFRQTPMTTQALTAAVEAYAASTRPRAITWRGRVVFMDEGSIVEQGAPDVQLTNPTHERTRAFLRRVIERTEIQSETANTRE